MTSAERSVIITGASTGIGRACALHMASLGWRVFAGIRRKADGDALRRKASALLEPIELDVTKPGSIRAARIQVEQKVGESGLAGLVNNAGIAYGGPVELLELDELRRLFEVNYFGLIAVTQAFLPLLRRGHGRVVNMSSVSGMVASPFLSPYTTSKWAVEALSDALRVELDPWQIKVSVVRPGAINTPIWSKGKRTADGMLRRAPKALTELYGPVVEKLMSGLRPHGITVDHVASAVARALTARHPYTRYHVGWPLHLVGLFSRLPDSWRDAYFRRRLRVGEE